MARVKKDRRSQSELIKLIQDNANVEMTIAFEKTPNKEFEENRAKELKKYLLSLRPKFGKKISPEQVDYRRVRAIIEEKPIRILHGKHSGEHHRDLTGKFQFRDLDIDTTNDPDANIRWVNPNNLIYVEIQGSRIYRK